MSCFGFGKKKDSKQVEKPQNGNQNDPQSANLPSIIHSYIHNKQQVLPKTSIMTAEQSNNYHHLKRRQTVQISINEEWHKALLHKQYWANQEAIDLIIRELLTLANFVRFLANYLNEIQKLVREKHFVINTCIFDIVKLNFVDHLIHNRKAVKPEEIIPSNMKHLDETRLIDLLNYMNGVLDQLYVFYGRELFSRIYTKNDQQGISRIDNFRYRQYLANIRKQVQKLGQAKSQIHQKQYEQIRFTILAMFQTFMKYELINQFLLNFNFIMTALERQQRIKVYPQIRNTLQRTIQHYYINRQQPDINFLIGQIQSLRGYISHGKMLEDGDCSWHTPPKKKYQQKKGKKPQKEKGRSSIQSNRQSLQQQSQKIQQKQSPGKIWIKYYYSTIKRNITHVRTLKMLQYVERPNEQSEILKYKLDAHLNQNELNVIRYLAHERNEYLLQIKIEQDKRPEDMPMIIQNDKKTDIIKQPAIVFQSCTLKGDRQFSKINKINSQVTFNPILIKNIWSFNNRKLVYSFIYYFAKTIKWLQEHQIHQLDFETQNFIKFGNIFYMIDLQWVFFTKETKENYQYYRYNIQIFKSWLQDQNINSRMAKLIVTDRRYQKIKDQYQQVNKNIEAFVQACLNIMHSNMEENHLRQFKQLVGKLFKDQKHQIIIQEEIEAVTSILDHKAPQGPNQDFYQYFTHNLQEIYINFTQVNKKKPLSRLGQTSTYLETQLERFRQASYFQVMKEKTICLIDYFRYKGLQLGQSVFLYERQASEHGVVISCRDDFSDTSLEKIVSKQRYIFLFLKNGLEIFQRLQKSGFLLLNTKIASFGMVGEQFRLKDFTFLFKIRMDHQSISQYGNEIQYDNDKYLVEASIFLLSRLFFDSQLRGELYDQQLSEETGRNIFGGWGKEQYFINRTQLKNGQLDYLHRKLDMFPQKSAQYINRKSLQQILQRKARIAHVNQLKSISNYIFTATQAQEELNQTAKQLFQEYNSERFYYILTELVGGSRLFTSY